MSPTDTTSSARIGFQVWLCAADLPPIDVAMDVFELEISKRGINVSVRGKAPFGRDVATLLIEIISPNGLVARGRVTSVTFVSDEHTKFYRLDAVLLRLTLNEVSI